MGMEEVICSSVPAVNGGRASGIGRRGLEKGVFWDQDFGIPVTGQVHRPGQLPVTGMSESGNALSKWCPGREIPVGTRRWEYLPGPVAYRIPGDLIRARIVPCCTFFTSNPREEG